MNIQQQIAALRKRAKRLADIRRLRARGVSLTAIAERYHISRQRVAQLLKAAE